MDRRHQSHGILQGLQLGLLIHRQRARGLRAERSVRLREASLQILDLQQQPPGRSRIRAALLHQVVQIGLALPHLLYGSAVRLPLLLLDLLQVPGYSVYRMQSRFLRIAYTVQFLFTLVATFDVWAQVGGQGHLDLMPWYWKLILPSALSLATVRATAAAVHRDRLGNRRTSV